MKLQQILLIVAGAVLCGSTAFAVYQLFWGPERLEFEGRSVPELLGGDALPIVIVVLVSVGVTWLVTRPFARFIFPRQIKNGVTTEAAVRKVWDTGTTINDDPEVGFLLEFTGVDGTPLQVEAKTVVSRLQVARVQPGITAQVRYDPQKPRRLQILALHLPEPRATSAAARMEELNELRDKGLINDEEYRQKREEILRAL